LEEKDSNLTDSYAQLSEAQKEIQAQSDAVDQAENAIREYRAKMRAMEDDM